MTVDLKNLSAGEIETWAASQGLDAYRGTQIRHWLFKKLVSSFRDMTNLSKGLRAELEEKTNLNPLELVKIEVSKDETQKFLFSLEDGYLIESVLIPERDHETLCISSQAGCAMNCRFCLTARQGLKRDLKASEIIEQVIQVKRSLTAPERLTNIVFMGMGEPLENYDSVTRAIRNMVDEDGMNFSHRKVTLSTCGIAPQIRRLGNCVRVNLAVSLNAADDATRSYLMPINRKYPLSHLMSACRDFPLPNRRMITFEYVLIDGVNNRDDDARKLARLLSGLRAKINLIPLNAAPHLGMSPPPRERVLRFQEIMIERQFTAIIRKSKGQDISAACGQLSGGQDLQ